MKVFLFLIPVVLMISVSSVYAQNTPDAGHDEATLMGEFLIEEEESLQITSSSKTADHIPKFLAVQHAQSGSISEINETAYLLELNDVSEKTVLFSDRPDRIVTSENTSDFIGNWFIGSNSFAIDAPNTIIVTDVDSNEQDVAIIELFNPVYDSDKKTLMYEVTLDNATSYNLSGEFGQTTLILDDRCSSPWDPRGC